MRKNLETVVVVIVTVALIAASIWLVAESFMDPDCPKVLGWCMRVTGFAFLVAYPYYLGRTIESYYDE